MTGFPPLILHCLHVTFSLDPIVLVIVLVIAVKKVYSVSLTVPNLRYGVVFVYISDVAVRLLDHK